MRRIHRAVRAIGVAMLAAAASGCWLQPGLNAGRSNWNPGETTITPANVGQLAELWDTQLATWLNDPISLNDRLYVSESQTKVHALDAATGAVVWTHEVVPSGEPTPVVCAFGPCVLFDPVYVDDDIVVPYLGYGGGSGPSQGDAVHLDPATGTQVDGHGPGNHDTQVAVADGELGALTAQSAPFGAGVTATVQWKGIIAQHLAGDLPTYQQIGKTFAITGGRILWSNGTQAEAYSVACPRQSPPREAFCAAPDWATDLASTPGQPAAVGTDRVAYSTNGTTSILDLATGAVQWTAPVSGRLAVTDDVVVVANDTTVAALPAAGCGAATCAPLWEAPVGSGLVTAPVVVGGDVVYVASGTQLLAYDVGGCSAATCAPLATVEIGHTPNSLIVDDGRVVVGSGDGHLVGFGLPG